MELSILAQACPFAQGVCFKNRSQFWVRFACAFALGVEGAWLSGLQWTRFRGGEASFFGYCKRQFHAGKDYLDELSVFGSNSGAGRTWATTLIPLVQRPSAQG